MIVFCVAKMPTSFSHVDIKLMKRSFDYFIRKIKANIIIGRSQPATAHKNDNVLSSLKPTQTQAKFNTLWSTVFKATKPQQLMEFHPATLYSKFPTRISSEEALIEIIDSNSRIFVTKDSRRIHIAIFDFWERGQPSASKALNLCK